MKYGPIAHPMNCFSRMYDYPSEPACNTREKFGMPCPDDHNFPKDCPLRDVKEGDE